MASFCEFLIFDNDDHNGDDDNCCDNCDDGEERGDAQNGMFFGGS